MDDISKIGNQYHFPFSECNCNRLNVIEFHCLEAQCNFIGYTINQLQEHRVYKHKATNKAITFNGNKP